MAKYGLQADGSGIHNSLMAAIYGGVQLKKVSAPAKAECPAIGKNPILESMRAKQRFGKAELSESHVQQSTASLYCDCRFQRAEARRTERRTSEKGGSGKEGARNRQRGACSTGRR